MFIHPNFFQIFNKLETRVVDIISPWMTLLKMSSLIKGNVVLKSLLWLANNK
jgi:hypothetical protein